MSLAEDRVRPSSDAAATAHGVSRASLVLDVLAMAVGAGILAAAVHGLELLVARHLLGELVWVSRDFVWMSPVAYTLVMLVPAACFVALSLAVPRRWVVGAAAFVLAAAAAFGVLLPYSQISRVASLVLALGVGYQVSRLVHRHPARWTRRARVLAIGGATAVAVLAVASPAVRGWTEGRRLAALPAPTDGPNVLLIILDTVRAASMSLNGYDEPTTPNLERWAADGVAFDWAFAPAPWTLPSHASVFTGRWAGETPADWKVPLDERDSTLAEILAARGYATAGFVGNMHYTSWDSGLARGFTRWDDYRRSWRQLVRSSSYTQTAMYGQLLRAESVGDFVGALVHPDLSIDMKHTFDHKDGSEVSAQFLEWQRAASDAQPGRPFFAFLNYFDGHQPYTFTPEFRKFRRQGSGSPAYRAAIAYLDAQIDSVLRVLRERGVLDNTVVVVTSDHGELFREHGLSGHAHNLYRNVLHVPLMVRAPGRAPAGARVAAPVSLRDLGATILEVAGAQAAFPGVSLSARWGAAADTSAAVTSAVVSEVSRAPNVDVRYPTARGAMKGLTTADLHYIRNGDGAEELYAYRTDTAEARNLAKEPDGAPLLARVRAELDSLLALRGAGGRPVVTRR